MKKKIALGVLTLALMVGGATSAFAQTDLSKASELKDLYSQMFNLQKQIVEKQIEAGAMTKEEANSAKEFIDQNQKYRNQAIDQGDLGGFYGQHCGGNGPSMMNQGPSSTNYNL